MPHFTRSNASLHGEAAFQSLLTSWVTLALRAVGQSFHPGPTSINCIMCLWLLIYSSWKGFDIDRLDPYVWHLSWLWCHCVGLRVLLASTSSVDKPRLTLTLRHCLRYTTNSNTADWRPLSVSLISILFLLIKEPSSSTLNWATHSSAAMLNSVRDLLLWYWVWVKLCFMIAVSFSSPLESSADVIPWMQRTVQGVSMLLLGDSVDRLTIDSLRLKAEYLNWPFSTIQEDDERIFVTFDNPEMVSTCVQYLHAWVC